MFVGPREISQIKLPDMQVYVYIYIHTPIGHDIYRVEFLYMLPATI